MRAGGIAAARAPGTRNNSRDAAGCQGVFSWMEDFSLIYFLSFLKISNGALKQVKKKFLGQKTSSSETVMRDSVSKREWETCGG